MGRRGREHSARVYRLAYRLTGNQHDAEDLTQEVFVRVFRSLHDYQPGTFEGWLHRITTNLFLDLVRRRARIRFEGLPEDAERIKGREATPAQIYDDAHLDHDVQTALDALLPEYRAAVVLCDIEGLSTRRSPTSSGSSSAPYAAASTAAAPSCAPPWPTAPRQAPAPRRPR